MDNAESEVAILILESTWLIVDNISAHARTDNAESTNSSFHSKLEMSPRQLLIHLGKGRDPDVHTSSMDQSFLDYYLFFTDEHRKTLVVKF